MYIMAQHTAYYSYTARHSAVLFYSNLSDRGAALSKVYKRFDQVWYKNRSEIAPIHPSSTFYTGVK